MKKKLAMSLTLVMLFSALFFAGPSYASSAPPTVSDVFIDDNYYGTSVFRDGQWHNRYYRGYLPYQGKYGQYYIYEGKLYRDDLPYPIY
mgnify:CR=1 FL=1